MKSPVEKNSLLKFFCYNTWFKKIQFIMDIMYNSNRLKSLLLSIETATEPINKEDNTTYCTKFSFLVKMKNYLK